MMMPDQTIADVEARLEKYLAERAKSRRLDQVEIHGLHVGDEREAILTTADLTALLASHRRMKEENKDLKRSVCAFCAPWAVTYARERGLPDGHIFANHYDILKRAGARMVDFTRHVQGDAHADR